MTHTHVLPDIKKGEYIISQFKCSPITTDPAGGNRIVNIRHRQKYFTARCPYCKKIISVLPRTSYKFKEKING